MTVICFNCHNPLIKSRNEISSIYCQNCNHIQPHFTIVKDEFTVEHIQVYSDTEELYLSPSDILKIFSDAVDSGFQYKNILQFNPCDLIMTNLCVLPITARPSVMINGNQCDDDLSYMYIEIVKLNRKMRKILDSCGMEDIKFPLTTDILLKLMKNANTASSKSKVTKINIDSIVRIISQLELHVKTIMNNSHQFKYQNDKNVKCIKSRLNGKGGLLRGHITGKRCDFSGRSVATGDATLGVDEIMIPNAFIKNLTIPEYVNTLNIKKMRKLMDEKKINRIKRNGELYTARNFIIKEGDVVERQLQDGDYILMNRQPTLHTGGFLGLRLKILKTDRDIKTIRFNIPACSTLNADFDKLTV